MDMSTDTEIVAANLSDWRKLGQGLHARYPVGGFTAAAQFLTAIGKAGDTVGHHPQVRLDAKRVDIKLISDDAICKRTVVGDAH